MATGNTQINGSDPSVLRQQERQTASALTKRVTAPATVSTSGNATSNATGAIRTLAPIVSGSDVVYPQSTTATSNNSVTVTSSLNNDSGDVTTVYSTNGAITVNPINQTINQYTSVDSGVSQIVAGNGVTISSTGGSGTGIVTINSSTVALGNIVSVNLDGNSANVLHGDGTWSADQTTYGNSNVAAYLPTYTGNIGGNVITANLFSGNGSSLSAIAGANVSGFVPNANVANTAFAVAAANVSGLGNIATINLTGSTSNVLYGNGVFAAVAGGANTGNVTFDDVTVQGVNELNLSAGPDYTANLAYLTVRAGDVASHIHFDTGNSEAYDLIVGNDAKFVQVSSTGNIIMSSYDGNVSYAMTLDTTGNLTIPNNIISNSTIGIDNRASGNVADINLYSADDILIQARDRATGSTAEGGDINIFAGDSAEDSDTSAGDIVIEAGAGGASNIDFGGAGGFIRIEAGLGGAASTDANGFSALSGGALTLRAGDAGTNNGNIERGATGGDVYIEAGDSTGNGDPGGSIILTAGASGANALAGQVQLIIPGGDVGPGGTWTFDGNGIIQLPNSGTIGNDGNNIDIGSTSAISLEASTVVNIYTDTGTAAYQWQFGDNGQLILPTIKLDVGNTINEQTVIQSQRKIIPALRYSAVIAGTTPTVVYTATSVDTTSMKVAMQIQHTGLGFEFFDVSATSSGVDTYYSVSNRLHPPGITDSTVVVDLNGSNQMQITVTITSGAANSWVTYDAVEFGIPQD